MKILDHINNIDNIIEEKKDEEKKVALFGECADVADGGLGFSSTTYTTVDMGNMHNIYSPNGNVSIIDDGPFHQVIEF